MLVFVLDKAGQPGHPTHRADWVRKQLRRKQAQLIGGGASGKPPVLVLNTGRTRLSDSPAVKAGAHASAPAPAVVDGVRVRADRA